MSDYYKTLGVEKNASDEDIKKAYRKLAHQHHPDKTGGDERKFKEINEAYQVLSNKEKRAQYDRFGRTFDGRGGNPFGGGFGFDFDPSQFADFGNIGDIFGDIFEGLGVRRPRKTYNRGSDLETHLDITLEEVFTGAKKNISINTFLSCEACSGAGHFAKEGFTACAVCDGRGEIKETQNTFFGAFARVKTCDKCRGLGKIPKKICGSCSGAGRLRGMRELTINLAPGIADSQIIKITGGGEAGERGALTGDLYVGVRVKPHAVFSRAGDDLIVKKSISLIDVLLGKPIVINTIGGKIIEVKIPEDWNVKEKLKVAGEGMPRFSSFGRGNLYIDFDIKTPKRLSSAAKKLLEDLGKEI